MLQVSEIQERLSQIPCPICRKTNYAILSRNEAGYAEVFYTARCTGCNYSFPVTVPDKAKAFADPDIAQQLKDLGCPFCRERGAELNFRCHPSVRESYYFVTCKSCKKPFQESAPMEAYE